MMNIILQFEFVHIFGAMISNLADEREVRPV
jgi:hypothetical protein